jgi:hypothetical protein
MKTWILALPLLALGDLGHAQQCNCTSYPFKPDPPCFGMCAEKLTARPVSETAAVKNIDPGVGVAIGVLSQHGNREKVDFKAITTKKDLERAALGAMKSNEKAAVLPK